jgi:hypothetical protein
MLARVKDALQKVSFEGASGHIAFDEHGCVIRKPTAWRVEGDTFRYVTVLK